MAQILFDFLGKFVILLTLKNFWPAWHQRRNPSGASPLAASEREGISLSLVTLMRREAERLCPGSLMLA